MGRAFKDLIVRETDGRLRLTFRSRTGAAVLEDVSAEISSEVLQAGDRWGALAANELLELDDDGVPHAVAPDFTPAQAPAALAPRERMSAAFGKLAAHLADGARHVTAAERAAWNAKANANGTYEKLTAGDSQKLNGKTLAMQLDGDTLSITWR